MKLLFAGWNGERPPSRGPRAEHGARGSEITVLSDDAPSASLKSTKNCKLRFVRGVPTARRPEREGTPWTPS